MSNCLSSIISKIILKDKHQTYAILYNVMENKMAFNSCILSVEIRTTSTLKDII